MADPPSYRDANGPDEPAPSNDTPRWVKIFGALLVVIILLFALMLLGKGHGPGRHMRSDHAGEQTLVASLPS